MNLIKEKQNKVFDTLKGSLGYKNKMQTPKIQKVIVSVGIGSVKDKGKIKVIQDRLVKITGQKEAARIAKKSIATFKSRQGDTIGYQITLRGQRMYDFLDRLIHIAIPRMRDFRGLPVTAIDEMGNFTIGIKEHTVFPETSDEDLKDVFGFAITIVTSASNKGETKEYLKSLGFPFKKEE
ncbi:MAG: 50S ribosomal protein L5 [Candidatus Pacebacteria bacterium]|jgi:large subunit ribosomal protein L5|nr:50S ribosomal protein L5 [Parcubacteria group bacterium]MDP6249671.1 50S ribosomal protein L5 [Candidatus Paceibacterota bacterium]MDP7159340.1 50S ribosomal protein L5 [Candidatus Paceibacterota bacterium]MDP7368420.1 50S ribosomal protein L5 [Candidatus Paceibacterota bacterium]MDP7466345.1 50S ribosomal protein L5 [Candidatus Paceibacterota bacterium]|tara:strand:+ start:1639 stop:2178 length:540 start_codon:yes stop_codon:yes gene_type:complete